MSKPNVVTKNVEAKYQKQNNVQNYKPASICPCEAEESSAFSLPESLSLLLHVSNISVLIPSDAKQRSQLRNDAKIAITLKFLERR